MDMEIRENAKRIVVRILKQAVKSGSLNTAINASYDELAAELDNKNPNYCKVCVQYLERKKLIEVDPDENSNWVFLRATAAAIDFLEP